MKVRALAIKISEQNIPLAMLKEIALTKSVPIFYRDIGTMREYIVTMNDYQKDVCSDLGFNITDLHMSRKRKKLIYKKLKYGNKYTSNK